MLLFLAGTDYVCNHALQLLSATHPVQCRLRLLCILLLAVAQLGSASSRLPLVSLNVLTMLFSCSTSHHRTGRLLP